jgi:hypothetical protein
MTRISSLAVDYYHAAKKAKMRTAAISGLVVVVVIICLIIASGSGDDLGSIASSSGGASAAVGQSASTSVTSDGGPQKAKSPGLTGASTTSGVERAKDFDADAAGEDHTESKKGSKLTFAVVCGGFLYMCQYEFRMFSQSHLP